MGRAVELESYSIRHYVIKFLDDLRQVGGYLQVIRFPPPIKLTRTTNIVESGVKHHKQTNIIAILGTICVFDTSCINMT
jgi:hypothetical protein